MAKRHWLWVTLGAIALIFSLGLRPPAPVIAQTAPTLASAGLTLENLGNGAYALVADVDFPPPEGRAICNGGFVVGSEGVLVIDPFHTPALANLLFDTVKTVTDKPIRYVLNTHYHFDHTGGNPAAVGRGIPIVGRGPIRELMNTRNRANDPNLRPPDVIINSDTEFWLGDRAVQVARVEGHAAGTDLVAYVPAAKVLYAGDMVFHERIPFLGDGNIRQWQGSLYRLMATYPEAKVVPGHGQVTDIKGLQAMQRYFSDLVNLALSWRAQNLTREQAIAQSSEIPAAYKNHRFQVFYATGAPGLPGNLETAYDQITRSAAIPLVP
ncbi:MAG: MBL fold metallo-hydrolase [Pseudanabaenaceae cyanobacterium]